MKYINILFLALLFTVSCNSAEEDSPKEEVINPINIQEEAPVFKNITTVQERYENGAPKIMGNFDSEGNRHGIWTFYYDNGFEERVYDYSHGQLHGMFLQFDNETGKIILRGQYKKGKKVGVWNQYYPTGELRQTDTIQ